MDVRIQEPDRGAHLGQSNSQVDRNGRFPHAPFAARDGNHVLTLTIR
jgi:hypothetical protein